MAATDVFGPFDVLKRPDGTLWELGGGAMGKTYKARDRSLNRTVALKVIAPRLLESETARGRFLREARSAARITHPNVAAVYQLGEHEGTWFYAMEFVDGETLEARVKRCGPFTVEGALAVAAQVARGLEAAGEVGLVHRDIKPANLMLVERPGGEPLVKIIDFGIAKATGPGDENDPTLTQGGFVGTAQYASPEQIEERELDARSDIYSMGCVLWFLLAGSAPFSGSSAAAVMARHLHWDPPWEKIGGLPECVRALLARMLAKNPSSRPPDARALRVELERCVAEVRAPARQAPYAIGVPQPGGYFLATEVASGRQLAAWPAGGEPGIETVDRPQIEAAVAALARQQLPGLLRARAVAEVGGRLYAFSDVPSGRPLIGLVRERRQIPLREALPILRQAAAAADRCREAGGVPVLSVSGIWIAEGKAGEEAEVTVSPLGMLGPAPAHPGDTIVPAGGGRRELSVEESVDAMAALAHELLAGRPPPPQPVPLGALGEGGNRFLRAALMGERTFGSASEFCDGLAAAEAGSHTPEPAPSDAAGTGATFGRGGSRPATRPAAARKAVRVPGLVWYGVGVAALALAALLASFPFTWRRLTERTEPAQAASAPPAPAAAPQQPPPPTPQTATKESPFVNSLGMEFVPSGTPGLLFCRRETRTKDFAAFASEAGAAWAPAGEAASESDPASMVSWEDAKAFCDWLSRKEGLVYRLPNDAEWSAAAGLSAETGATPREKDGKAGAFPWGEQWPPPAGFANFAGEEGNPKWKIDGYRDPFRAAAPAGSFAPDKLGLFDMAGNLWEWCADAPAPGDEGQRVLRGGSWAEIDPGRLKVSARHFLPRDQGSPYAGFRVALEAGRP